MAEPLAVEAAARVRQQAVVPVEMISVGMTSVEEGNPSAFRNVRLIQIVRRTYLPATH